MNAELWRRHAARTVRRMNFAWWLETFAPAASLLSLTLLAGIYLARSRGWLPREGVPAGAAAGIAALYVLAALLCLWRARRRFLKLPDGFVLLESRLRLQSALTAANAGARSWPPAPERVDDGLRLSPRWLGAPAALAAASLLSAFLLPVSAVSPVVPATPPPRSWEQMEAMLETLKTEEIVQPEDLRKAEEQLEILRAQDPADHYSHHSLEASDTLLQALKQAAGALARHLMEAAHAADTLQSHGDRLGETTKQRLAKEFENALQALQNAPLKPGDSLMSQLKEIDPSKLKEIDPEKLREALANLRKKAVICQLCEDGKDASEGDEWMEALVAVESENATPGRGGVARGPGTAELTYNMERTELGTRNLEGLESTDLSRAAFGDTLATANGEHELDKTASAPVQGGAPASPGSGGDTVWRETLPPAERKVLQRYFK